MIEKLLLIVLLFIIVALVVLKIREMSFNIYGSADLRSKVSSLYKYPIIHIAGPPGSGKTYLGHKIRKKYPNLLVVDTDIIIQHDNLYVKADKIAADGNWKSWAKKSAGEFFANSISKKTSSIISSFQTKKPIIFVGIPHIIYGDDIYISDLYKIADHKFYLNTSLNNIVKRRLDRDYISRICKDKKYVKGVMAGQYFILPFSKDGVDQGMKYLNNTYVKDHNYKKISSNQIMKQIQQISNL